MTKILFVDDSDLMLKIAKTMLEKFGYQVLTATNGKEAIDLAEKEKPEIIFLDAELPEMDGWEVCKIIKSHPLIKDIPILMSTGHDLSGEEEQLKSVGAMGFVTKPYNPAVIDQKIKEILKQ
ncbi:MAG TPA: two-component system response regulator [Elusimicrobia bacterium]|jgi:two-component system alkaline phosphatase synthesis response regulator PhoP|nr:two-component system response regulator [Elusimicrobiota bacterium]